MTKRLVIVHALPPSRLKRPKPAQPAQALPARIVHSPKRGQALPVVLAPYNRDARADAADDLRRELIRRAKGEGGPS